MAQGGNGVRFSGGGEAKVERVNKSRAAFSKSSGGTHAPWASFKRLGSSDSLTESFLARTRKAGKGLGGDLAHAAKDIGYTIVFLTGIALTAVWVDYLHPHVCKNATSAKFLTFDCTEGLAFSWIALTTVVWTLALPYHSFNIWASALASEFPARTRIIKCAAQTAAAAGFALSLSIIFGDHVRESVYAESFPKVNLCAHESSTQFHRRIFQGKDCLHDWPSINDAGELHLGAIVHEALHTMVLNVALGIAVPYCGYLAPYVVALGVVSVIRSPYGHTTGPALNLSVATASAAMHGGFDSLFVHGLGTLVGVISAGYVVNAVREFLPDPNRVRWFKTKTA